MEEILKLSQKYRMERLTASGLLTSNPCVLRDVIISPNQRPSIRSVTGTDPAAGAEISETVPAGKQWRIRGIYFVLVTSSTVANRGPCVVIDDGTNTLAQVEPGGAQTASVTRDYSVGVGLLYKTLAFNPVAIPLNAELTLPAGYRIRTNTYNLQANDNFAAPQLLVEEWIESEWTLSIYDGGNTQGTLLLAPILNPGKVRHLKFDPPLYFRHGVYADFGSKISNASFRYAGFRE